ncbi:AmmeMemoRadiSam system radical SAM enzyme, partial [Vibrio parahaemolyticus]|nr:AmmeMemoRadiSam system radical SAM enzyme [Vibrio parahaemolyticus]
TSCPRCGTPVIERDWYEIRGYALDDAGACRACGTRVPGVFDGPAGDWGTRRVPVAMGRRR